MKTSITKTTLALAVSLFGAANLFAQTGGSFQIVRSTIASGGGTSSGGMFRVTGTLGQPVAGPASGGALSVQGGFWSSVPTTNAPLLRITPTGIRGAVVSWPAPSTGWVLQQTTVLAAPPGLTVWTDVASPPVVVVGGENTVTFNPAIGARYFRLRQP